jgi:hypothetical protein
MNLALMHLNAFDTMAVRTISSRQQPLPTLIGADKPSCVRRRFSLKGRRPLQTDARVSSTAKRLSLGNAFGCFPLRGLSRVVEC